MKKFISSSLFLFFVLFVQMAYGQFFNIPNVVVANNDIVTDMWRRGRTGIGFGGGAAYNAADPFFRARLKVTNGIMAHYVQGIIGDLDNATWAGIGIGNPGGPVQPYGYSMARNNNLGFYNLLTTTNPLSNGEDVIAGFGNALTNARNRFVIRAYNTAATNPLNFKDILIANPNGAVGVNAEPFSSLWVDSKLTNNPGFPNPIFKSIVIAGNQVIDAWTTVSAMGNQQNSSLASDKVLVEGFRSQTPDFFGNLKEGVAVNLQVVKNDRNGVIPLSIGGIPVTDRGEYAELTWQSLDFQNIVDQACGPPVENVDKNFYISFRNGLPGVPGNNSFSVDNKLPVATFTSRGRVGINTTAPVCDFSGNPIFLDVNGGAVFSGTFYPSDARYKKDIEPIANAMDIIRKLQGTTYEMKHDEFPKKKFMSGKQYGFIAQDLNKVLPELAVQDAEGYYAVNYTSLIPILSQAIKEQDALLAQKDAEIARINNELQEIKNIISEIRNTQSSGTSSLGYKLLQNTPNPSSLNTTVGFVIPSNASFNSASVNVYDLSGKMLQTYSITSQQTSVDIDSTQLSSGTYLYDLLVDGQQIDVKRMVIVNNY